MNQLLINLHRALTMKFTNTPHFKLEHKLKDDTIELRVLFTYNLVTTVIWAETFKMNSISVLSDDYVRETIYDIDETLLRTIQKEFETFGESKIYQELNKILAQFDFFYSFLQPEESVIKPKRKYCH